MCVCVCEILHPLGETRKNDRRNENNKLCLVIKFQL